MTLNYSQHFQTQATSQSQPIPGTDQVENSAGGFVWAVDDWTRLDRFLVLGSEGGSYYAGEHTLTRENAEAVVRCVQADGERLVQRIVEISHSGRAPKNDPALFALAIAAGMGDERTKSQALDALPKVARISTHLFTFVDYVQGFRGWGRGLRRAVGAWYNEKTVEQLAYQVLKYRQRNGWSHRDVLRLASPKPRTPAHHALYGWVVAKGNPRAAVDRAQLPELIGGFEQMQQAMAGQRELQQAQATYRKLKQAAMRPYRTLMRQAQRAYRQARSTHLALFRDYQQALEKTPRLVDTLTFEHRKRLGQGKDYEKATHEAYQTERVAKKTLQAIRRKVEAATHTVDIQQARHTLAQAKITSRQAAAKDAVRLIEAYPELSWEMIPTELLGERVVWEALLPHLPMTALLRNLARLTANGTIAPLSATTRKVCEQLTDETRIRAARVHPIAVLGALATYARGRGDRGHLKWTPVDEVTDALNEAFYLAFGNVAATGKRWLLALDVSASMTWFAIAGMPGLTPRVASAALAMVTARVESQCTITAFSAPYSLNLPTGIVNSPTGIVPVNLSPSQRLKEVIQTFSEVPTFYPRTDCALPMLWALENNVEVDTFVVYTDFETWYGDIHPAQALRQYRRQTGIAAKLVVVGMIANGFSIADPNDPGMLDVVGFDTATPGLIANFSVE